MARWLVTSIGLFVLNLSISWRLLFLEYTGHFNSLEPFYYVLAQAVRARWLDSGWWPVWNMGMPFDYTYPPLLPHLVALVAALFRISTPRAFHIVIAIFYALGPVTFYAMARFITKLEWPSLAAALLYSLWSPSALLARAVATDLGSV